VIADLVEYGLATPVATTVPLVTYKTPDWPEQAPRRDRDKQRRGRGRP
jgi:release factor H-coupled RctB family protein